MRTAGIISDCGKLQQCIGVLLKKQIGGNRDGRNQLTKIHFDSPIKII